MQQFFFIDKESAKQLETGKDDVELIFDSRKENLSDDTFLALQEERFGSYEDKNGRIQFKFPEKYKDLIEKRQKEGKLAKIILFKKNGQDIIEVNSQEDLLEESKISKKNKLFYSRRKVPTSFV